MTLAIDNYSKLVLISFFSFFTLVQLNAQEICDNGIDDTGNGLIDLNDPECACSDLMASSLIPNPSFEDMTCCPMAEAELTCAVGWEQASFPTTDYVHTCGILGNPFLGFDAPQPFPDGEGGIGFRDGKPGVPNFKEYAGACLTQAMNVGTEYRLDFFVGFHSDPSSLTFDMAIFGTTDCNNLPFGNGDQNFGCPTNGPGWEQLGAMTVNGMEEWKNVIFNFVADQNYTAIVLGPACATNPNFADDPYFFFDRLVLAESIMFEVPLADISGNICDDNLVITSSDGMGGTYQWYKDGVALLGETSQSLSLQNTSDVEGTYEVVITTSTGCFDGEEFELVVPSYSSTLNENFCEGGSIIIAGQEFDTAGTYQLELSASDGCDSLVMLTLESTATMTETISFEGCEGEEIVVNNETYDTGGTYTQNLTSVDGCDSVLTIEYITSTPSIEFASYELCEGDEITLNGQTYNAEGNFNQSLINIAGCDSTLNISIATLPTMMESVAFDICQGCSIDVNGQTFNQEGTYTQNLIATNGCDSILNINISITVIPPTNLMFDLCEGETLELNGQTYNQEGNYVQNLSSTNGGDSIVNIAISILANSESSSQFSLCEGDSFSLNGETYNQAGSYTQSLTNAVGCDSTLNITVLGLSNSESNLQFSICDTESVTVNGEVFDAQGNYLQTLTSSNGCDSLIYVNIFLEAVCSDCIFYNEFNAGSVVLTRQANNSYNVALVNEDVTLLEMELSSEELQQFSAIYLVDNEVQIQGKKSKMQALINGSEDAYRLISESTWNTSKKFTLSEITTTLPFSTSELPKEINEEKLNHLFSKMQSQANELRVGGELKINFR